MYDAIGNFLVIFLEGLWFSFERVTSFTTLCIIVTGLCFWYLAGVERRQDDSTAMKIDPESYA